MKLRQLVFLVTSFLLLGVFWLIASKPGSYSATLVDVSWPNCKVSHPTMYRQGIIGVTGGLDFHANKCLVEEAGWFSRYELYMNTGYPGDSGRKFQYAPLYCKPTDHRCLAYNYGYQATVYALDYAARQNIHATMWWLDVETDNSWTTVPSVNVASLRGAIAAVKQQVFMAKVGFYSYPGQWDLLTGSWQSGLPVWAATGQTTKQAALLACRSKSFTGAPIELAQYTIVLDENITCR